MHFVESLLLDRTVKLVISSVFTLLGMHHVPADRCEFVGQELVEYPKKLFVALHVLSRFWL